MFILFFWIIFGGLVGLIVGILKDIREPQPLSLYTAFGIVGGILGGLASTPSWL